MKYSSNITTAFSSLFKFCCISLYCNFVIAVQQLPSFDQISRLSQSPTDASIYGGVSNDNGNSYANEFSSTDAIYLQIQIMPDSEHIGKEGSVFIVVNIPGLGMFQQGSDGQFSLWGGSLNSLQPRLDSKILQSSEIIEVVNNTVLGELGVSGFEIQIFAGYRENSTPNDLIFTRNPMVFSITSANNQTAEEYYTENFASYVESICSYCHSDSGPAKVTRLLFSYSKLGEVDAESGNFAALQQFVVDVTAVLLYCFPSPVVFPMVEVTRYPVIVKVIKSLENWFC